jgi:beta-aspartyl-peptidase (threonine type)
MKKFLFIISMVCLSFSCNDSIDSASAEKIASEKQSEFAIIIHGGAGKILKGNLSKKKEKAYRNKLEEAIKKGYTILKNGGTRQLAVVKTIQVM